MPARCPSCGAVALAEGARFCVGCGGQLPAEPAPVIASAPRVETPPPPPAAVEPSPIVSERRAPRTAPARPRRSPSPSRRDPSPMVPVSVVVAGVVALLAVLLVLLLIA